MTTSKYTQEPVQRLSNAEFESLLSLAVACDNANTKTGITMKYALKTIRQEANLSKEYLENLAQNPFSFEVVAQELSKGGMYAAIYCRCVQVLTQALAQLQETNQ